jgi:hypothetical protein
MSRERTRSRAAAMALLGILLAVSAHALDQDRPKAHSPHPPVREVTRDVGHATRDAARAVGHAAREVTRDIGHVFRNLARRLRD